MATQAVVGTGNLTLLDAIRRTDPDFGIARIVEQLTQLNPMLQDAVWKEGNLSTGHRVTSRTGLPSFTYRKFNQGVATSKSQTNQYDEPCAIIEGKSVVDAKLAMLNGNEAAFRASEDISFVQSLSNEVSRGIFYNNAGTNPEKFMGLAPRFASSTAAYGSQIIKCCDGLNGHTTASGSNQTSIWLVGWSDRSVYGIYPKGMVGGLQMEDMGKLPVDDGTGNNASFRAWITYWDWNVGLVVEDWRYVVRIANVDVVNMSPTGTDLIDALIKATQQVQDWESTRLVLYANRKAMRFLRQQATYQVKASGLTYETFAGKPLLAFDGIPFHRTDALNSTESIVP
jgi:hypothetical protein